MSIKEAFLLALRSMRTSKMRSFLTMLGIIIGVAAVIILTSLINGFSGALTSSFNSMGTNTITVSLFPRSGDRTVTPDEMLELAQQNDKLVHVSPNVAMNAGSVKNGTASLSRYTITGVNEYYNSLRAIKLSGGRFLSYIDMETRAKVCVIGTYVQSELFDGLDPMGQELRINGESYTVVGVLSQTGDGTEYSNDNIMYVPYTTAMRASATSMVSSYVFNATGADTASGAASDIKLALTLKLGSSDYFYVMSQDELLDSINEVMGQLTMVLVGIAAISLLVGGIGIMNIMLVSVTERTREIGIRKALGGKRRDILGQFLIEAASTSAVGGILGIALGAAASILVGNLIGISGSPTVYSIILSFSVSAGIGIIFGFFPARRASKLNPIDALRYE